MTAELVLDNATVVLPDRLLRGHLVCRDGEIAEIDAGRARTPGAIDLEGDYLLPGLVELHTDNLERHVAPRPKVRWPIDAALLAHDAQIAAAGITTVLDALAVVDRGDSPVRGDMLQDAAAAVGRAVDAGLLRADHFIHLRCEVSFEGVVGTCEALLEDERVRLVSLMDHTPGQRQFTSIEQYYTYYQGKFGYSDAEMTALIDRRQADQRLYADPHRRRLAELCRDRGMPLASHDDATAAHVEEAIALGMSMAEFPTTVSAAGVAHERGMAVIMGAPNVVRGGSHSGNVSARTLAAEGTLDILSSDYVPASLLHAAFLLHDEQGTNLPQAIAMISSTPARALGLEDRGEIAVGKRADLVRARRAGALPVVRQVWRAAERIV
ncbi:MAG TPA: alpha-D-ribose 1-methylphosphonate 5-triphosphate diphosphatase [Stellaceae bacterium]|nr:alpha-D-ribose 1-methylphosphonate 5-triphosphate diphosphatase [Stellaceae bacterium]